jgi:hypothetical protein
MLIGDDGNDCSCFCRFSNGGGRMRSESGSLLLVLLEFYFKVTR